MPSGSRVVVGADTTFGGSTFPVAGCPRRCEASDGGRRLLASSGVREVPEPTERGLLNSRVVRGAAGPPGVRRVAGRSTRERGGVLSPAASARGRGRSGVCLRAASPSGVRRTAGAGAASLELWRAVDGGRRAPSSAPPPTGGRGGRLVPSLLFRGASALRAPAGFGFFER